MRDIAPLLRSFAQENATRFLSLLSLRRTLRRFALQKRGFGSRFATKEKSPRPTDLGLFSWLGMRDSNPRMLVPETSALPLGESPIGSETDYNTSRVLMLAVK